MSSSPSQLERARCALRREFLARRNALPATVIHESSTATARHLAASAPFLTAECVAAYVALDSELDPVPLIDAAFEAGKTVYLPRVLDAQRMEFVRWQAGEPLQPNRFGIPEPTPDATHILAPETLDLVLVPLLAFDTKGNRLGFGAGFYDRTFAFKRDGRARPTLCGYAYTWQQTSSLPAAEWDVALDAVATERGTMTFDLPGASA
ncbi:MAG: 5-formyltetrahydrofolate cyclo-ligase [Gammaproteobacteria bacterium]